MKNTLRAQEIKLRKGCTDCGFDRHPAALEFDHLDSSIKWKPGGAAFQAGWTWSRIETEIAKCEVVCANCHRIRTAERRKEAA